MTEPNPLREWYKAFKADATCLTCEYIDIAPVPGRVQFHHINPAHKIDSISNMIFRTAVLPERYHVKPVTFALELMKCTLLCPEHHQELHKAQDAQDEGLLAERYDFTLPFYRQRLAEFRQHALDLAPLALRTEITTDIQDMMEGGEIVFDKMTGWTERRHLQYHPPVQGLQMRMRGRP